MEKRFLLETIAPILLTIASLTKIDKLVQTLLEQIKAEKAQQNQAKLNKGDIAQSTLDQPQHSEG